MPVAVRVRMYFAFLESEPQFPQCARIENINDFGQ